MKSCRLCAGTLRPRFSKLLLQKHEVRYFECEECGSMQTEEPYWLDEAYAINLSRLDTGAAQRNLTTLAATLVIAKMLGVENVVDKGGGDGLLCRMLRDYGLNCFVHDKFATPTYAQGYTDPDFATPDMVIACEVVEHFANPSQDLAAVFETGSPIVMLTTGLYEGQSSDWWYLASETGQHVFFYSPKAMRMIGDRYAYAYVRLGRFLMFTRNASAVKLRILSLILRGIALPFLRAGIQLLPTPGVARDLDQQSKLA